jgi:hypothetical protein
MTGGLPGLSKGQGLPDAMIEVIAPGSARSSRPGKKGRPTTSTGS